MSENMENINLIPEGDSIPEIQRAMPFSNEAEQSVLGAMFLDKDCIPDVMARVKSDDFYIERHSMLFGTLTELYNMGKPIDLITIEEQLTLMGILDKIGGIKFVVDIANSVPSTESVIYYADIVKNKSVLRKLIKLSSSVENICYRGDDETDSILAKAQQGIIEITQDRISKGLVHINRYINESIDLIDQNSKKDDSMTGMPTGFADIDKKTAGLHPAEFIILAGRPGMGKTSFALNIAQNAAVKYGKTVAIFSLEMPGIEIANRLLSSEAKINSERIKKGDFRDEDWGKLATAANALSKAGIYIEAKSSITVEDIVAESRKLMLEKGLDLVVIDYLQLMSGSGRGSENRRNEIDRISRGLKVLANDLNIPVIALSQLSRDSVKEKREPGLIDLRESGSLEQDADAVMFLHREGYYNEEVEFPNKTKCIFAKYRKGETGYIDLTWLGEYTSFSDWSNRNE